MNVLRDILKNIYGVEDKFLVPMNSGWFAPTIDPEEKVGTFIGYRIISKKSTLRAYQNQGAYTKPIRILFRLSFVGPQAEDLHDQTLIWDDRTDIQQAFAKYGVIINYTERQGFSYPIKAQGYNDRLAWVVDFTCQTSFDIETNYPDWFHVDTGTENGNKEEPTWP